MITPDIIKQASTNLRRDKVWKLDFKSFIIGLAIGLTVCGLILISL